MHACNTVAIMSNNNSKAFSLWQNTSLLVLLPANPALRLRSLTLSRRHQEVNLLLSCSPAALRPRGLDKVTARCFYRLLGVCFSSRDGLNSPHLLPQSSMGFKTTACFMRMRSHKSGPEQKLKQVCRHKHTRCRTPPTGRRLLPRAY